MPKTLSSKQLVALAIRAGYHRPADIAEKTALLLDTVYHALHVLRKEHNAENVLEIYKKIMPREMPPKFPSSVGVYVSEDLSPEQAANFLKQVLGNDYCDALKKAL